MEATIKGAFTDDQGNCWEYCDGVCNLEPEVINEVPGRRGELIRVPVSADETEGHCVLFQMGVLSMNQD